MMTVSVVWFNKPPGQPSHWLILLGSEDSEIGNRYDVISGNIQGSWVFQWKEDYDPSKSRLVGGTVLLGTFDEDDGDKLEDFDTIARKEEHRPIQSSENCQTYVRSVITEVVAKKILPQAALTTLDTIPTAPQ
jgi:hypothetical protein